MRYSFLNVMLDKIPKELLCDSQFMKPFWEEYSRSYKDLIFSDDYQNLLDACVQKVELSPHGKILDLGCSFGTLPAYLYCRGYGSDYEPSKIVGTDFVEPKWLRDGREQDVWFKYLRRWLARKTHAGDIIDQGLWYEAYKRMIRDVFEYRNLDLSKTPYNGKCLGSCGYDNVISNMVLTYISKVNERTGKQAIAEIFKEVFKVLKPGGQFVWTTPRKGVNFFANFFHSTKNMLSFNPERKLVLASGLDVIKHALIIQKLGKIGVYTFLDTWEFDEILHDTGFVIDPSCWTLSFGGQVWVNSCYKPA